MKYVARKKSKVYRKPIKAKPKISKKLKAAVQQIVSKNAESKQVYRSENSATINTSITTATDAFQLVPNCGTGVTDHSRIGDQTRAQSLTIKGHILSNLTLTGISQCRMGIRMMIVTPKQYNNFNQIQSNATLWLPLLLRKGATVSAFTGVIPDLYAPISTEAITLHYNKVMYINTPYVQTAVGDANIYNSCHFFSKTFNLKNKLLRYDANIDSGLTPVNYSPVLLVGYVRLDGTAPDANNQFNLSYTATLNYEDS